LFVHNLVECGVSLAHSTTPMIIYNSSASAIQFLIML
jgi:hypothetical protein